MVPIRRPFCLGWLQQIVSQQKQQRFRCFFDLVSEKTAKRYTDIFSLPFFVEINAWWHHARDIMMACNELKHMPCVSLQCKSRLVLALVVTIAIAVGHFRNLVFIDLIRWHFHLGKTYKVIVAYLLVKHGIHVR